MSTVLVAESSRDDFNEAVAEREASGYAAIPSTFQVAIGGHYGTTRYCILMTNTPDDNHK